MELRLGSIAKAIIPKEDRVILADGKILVYEKLMLATGGTPRRLPFDYGRIIHFRTLSDYRRLRLLTQTGERFAVIGGGFMGSEIAAALKMNGKDVTMMFPGDGIGGRIFSRGLSGWLDRLSDGNVRRLGAA